MLRWMLLVAGIVILSVAAVFLGPLLLTTATTEDSFVGTVPEIKGPPGKLVIEGEPIHDFGTMAQFTSGEKIWNLRNEGEGDLLLVGGHPDCSCTVLNLGDGKTVVLKPGETFPLHVKWETKANQNAFEKKASIYVRNDPTRDEIRLVIRGNVQPAVLVFPEDRALNFAELPNNETRKTKAVLSSPDMPGMKILGVSTSRPELFDVSFGPLPQSDLEGLQLKTGYQIEVGTKPVKSLGVFQSELVVQTDHPAAPEIRFLLGGKLVGPIGVLPETVRYSGNPSPDGASATAIITVRGQDATEFTVLSKPDPLTVSIQPIPPAPGITTKTRQYRLNLQIPPDCPPGAITGDVELRTSHPDVTELKIPVSISVINSN
jgi:hypothetical protein